MSGTALERIQTWALTAVGGYWQMLQNAVAEVMAGTLSASSAIILTLTACALLAVVLLLRVIFDRRGAVSSGTPLARLTRPARLISAAAALLFFGVFGAWAWQAPLSSAAVAHGVVSPDGSRKTIQHLEGGIIRTINVREGDRVEAGNTLMTLEDVRALARLEELQERMVYLTATGARLQAEELGSEAIAFPASLIGSDNPSATGAMQSQGTLFQNRRETQLALERILDKRVDQLNEEISGLGEVIAAQEKQISLVEQELGIAQGLYEQGLQRLPPILALQRQLANLQAERAANRAAIARLGQQIGETELQLVASQQQNREEVSEELARVRAELASIRSQLPEREDTLARTTVIAPISGRVMNVQVTTERGGILRPGDNILDIVPDDSELIIDARLRPQDIETVYPGLRAKIILTAYTQRNLPQIFGSVRSVSADRLIDDRTGEPYFLAKIHVDAGELAALGADIELMAGMPADVMVLTGQSTLFDFLIQPFVDSVRVSFREN